MQTIVITGRLSKDAEIRQAGSSEVCAFDVAVDQGFGDKKVTNWFRCQFWGKRGTSVQPYLLKGSSVTVSGELETSMYQDKMQLGVRVNEVQLPPRAQAADQVRNQLSGNGGGAAQGKSRPSAFDSDLDDDVPF